MKNLATCCLPEMANHGSIKIRVGKKAEASQRGTWIKEWNQLIISMWRNESIIGWEIAKETFEGSIIRVLQTASDINLVLEKVSSIFPHQWPMELKEDLIYFTPLSSFSMGSFSFLHIFYLIIKNTTPIF